MRGTRISVCAIAAGVAVACSFRTSATTTDGRLADALPDGPAICPSIFASCQGDALITCAQIGSASTTTPCVWGCVTGAPDHCGVFTPSGGGVGSGDVDPGSFGGVLPTTFDSVSINTDTGAIKSGGTVVRGPGTGVIAGIDYEVRGNVGMFRFASLAVTGSVLINGALAVAFVSNGPASIASNIDARGSCTGTTAGPGGFAGGATNASGGGVGGGQSGAIANGFGGGGGGNGGTGGMGGPTMSTSGGGTEGDDNITLLFGGGGGGGGGNNGAGGPGGGGGGGFQLVSNQSITFATAGSINAGGCGGRDASDGGAGGGGGGAGGSILLEAPSIVVGGKLAANGGGAGDGGAGDTNRASHGMLGSAAAQGIGAGGAGGAGTSPNGVNGGDAGGGHGGGGGGGVGRLRFNTIGGANLATTGAILSPPLGAPGTSTCTQGSAAVN